MPPRPTHHTARELFAMNVRKLRHGKGLSQEGLADLSSLHRTFIGCVERSEKNVSIDSMERIAKALGVAIKDLLS